MDQPERPGAVQETFVTGTSDFRSDDQGDGHADAAGTVEGSSQALHKAGHANGQEKKAERAKSKTKGKAKQVDNNNRELSILEKLALSPYSSELHLAHIQSAGTDEEREEARAFMAQMVPLSEHLWLQWIHDRKSHVGNTLEGKVEVLELYKRACSDTFCKREFSRSYCEVSSKILSATPAIKLHQEYARYVLATYFEARGYTFPDVLEDEEMSGQQGPSSEESAAAVFDEEFVDGELAAAVNNDIRWHLSQVHLGPLNDDL